MLKVMVSMPPFTAKGVPLVAVHVRVNAAAVQGPVASRVSSVDDEGVAEANAAAPPAPVATHVTVPAPVQMLVLAVMVIVSATSAAPFGDAARACDGVNVKTS